VVERVRTVTGKPLYARSPQSFGRIIEPRHVAMMNQMMRETLRMGTAQKAQLPGWPAAGKDRQPARISVMPGSSATRASGHRGLAGER